MMKKRGDTTVNMLTVIVLALLLIGIVVYFMYRGSEVVSEGTQALKLADYQGKIVTCEALARSGTRVKSSYCYAFSEIKEQWINCEYEPVKRALEEIRDEAGNFELIECNGGGEDERLKCEELQLEEPRKSHAEVLVNGKTCEYWLGSGSTSTTTPPANNTESGSTTGSTESGSNEEPEPMALDQ